MKAPASTSVDSELRLVCSEIWGGNRPISNPIELPGVRGQLYLNPCSGGRGGDVHYLSVCGSGLLSRICLADVAGHGDTIAAVSDKLHRLLRRYMNQPDQRRVLADLNVRLEQQELAAMTTAAAATYYPPSGELSLSYAGHPPGWLWRAAMQRWERVASTPARDGLFDLPLAVSAETRYSRHRERVAVGDRLLLFTDGVLEAPAPGGELFGDERFAQLLQRSSQLAPAAAVAALLKQLVEFTGDARLAHDDLTILWLEFVPGPRGPAPWHALKNRIVRPRGNSRSFASAV